MNDKKVRKLELRRAEGYFAGRFMAMASPCEILVESDDAALAYRLVRTAMTEALRVEAKYSRYRRDNIVHQINTRCGRPIEVDEETAGLLDYANHCHSLSGGRFDITSGALRRVWRFDGSDAVPDSDAVKAVLAHVGWNRVRWQRPVLTLPAGMEIDFGGIGKEYAVDRAAYLLTQLTNTSFLINFGGDLLASGPRAEERPWVIGVEDPCGGDAPLRQLSVIRGALATSGDARRFLMKNGIRYSHILDPRTGWPIPDAPRSVTVAAERCLEAGMMATFAILHGSKAKDFLANQRVSFWLT